MVLFGTMLTGLSLLQQHTTGAVDLKAVYQESVAN